MLYQEIDPVEALLTLEWAENPTTDSKALICCKKDGTRVVLAEVSNSLGPRLPEAVASTQGKIMHRLMRQAIKEE